MKGFQYIKVKGTPWRIVATRTVSFWHQNISNEGSFHGAKNYYMTAPMLTVSVTINGTETHMLINDKNFTRYGDSAENLMRSTKKMALVTKRFETGAKKVSSALQKLLQNPTASNWNIFIKIYTTYCGGLFTTFMMGYRGTELLEQVLRQRNFSENDIRKLMGIITYPTKHSPLFNSQLDLLKVGVKVQRQKLKDKQIDILLQKWLDHYRHTPVNFCENPWTIKDAKQQLSVMLERNCAREITNLENNHKEKVKRANTFLKNINDSEITQLARSIQTASYLNEFRKQVSCRVSLYIRPIFHKVAELEKLSSWSDCYYLTPQEVGKVLAGERLNAKKLKQQRKVVALYVFPNGKQIMLPQPDAKRLATFSKKTQGQVNAKLKQYMVSGVSANVGIVRGTVKVISGSRDFGKFKAKDILVAPATSVDYIPIMEKAAAFVTNQGGITSHAAIVSREMNKPCIVNTKIATQVFKDGDYVEVDANKGIIKKL